MARTSAGKNSKIADRLQYFTVAEFDRMDVLDKVRCLLDGRLAISPGLKPDRQTRVALLAAHDTIARLRHERTR
jgi:hypothetical protein